MPKFVRKKQEPSFLKKLTTKINSKFPTKIKRRGKRYQAK